MTVAGHFTDTDLDSNSSNGLFILVLPHTRYIQVSWLRAPVGWWWGTRLGRRVTEAETMSENKLQAIKYTDGHLQLLDQRLLPYETVYLDVPDPKAAWQQIKVRPWCNSMHDDISVPMVACIRLLHTMRWCSIVTSTTACSQHIQASNASHAAASPCNTIRTWWCVVHRQLV
jgi:hypothetical protein